MSLERHIRIQEAVSNIVEKYQGDSLNKVLHSWQCEVEELRAAENKRQLCLTLAKSTAVHPIALDIRELQRTMNNLCIDIASILVCTETLQPCGMLRIYEADTDLQGLLDRVLGDHKNTALPFSFHSLIQSLLSAAVCEWVFEATPDEDCLSFTLREEALLQNIANLCG